MFPLADLNLCLVIEISRTENEIVHELSLRTLSGNYYSNLVVPVKCCTREEARNEFKALYSCSGFTVLTGA